MQKVIRATLDETQKQYWDNFVTQNEGSFGMLWQWNITTARYFKHEFIPLLLVDEHGNIFDVCPFIYDKKTKKLYSGGFCSSKGGSFFPTNMPNFIQYLKRNVTYSEISVLSYQENLLPQFLCAKHQDIATNLVDNNDFESFLKRVKSNLRRNYKKALRNNLKITEGKTQDDIAQFYEIYRHIMEKNNAKQIEPKEWFEQLFQQFTEHQALYFVENEAGKVIASVWFFISQYEVYYYAGGSLSEYASLQSGPFMLLALYQKAFEEQIPTVNLGPVNLDTRRYQFKKKFNSQIKPTYHFFYYKNPLKHFSKVIFYHIRDYILARPQLYEKVKKIIKT